MMHIQLLVQMLSAWADSKQPSDRDERGFSTVEYLIMIAAIAAAVIAISAALVVWLQGKADDVTSL